LGGDLKSTSECLFAPRPSRKRLGACRLCAAGRGDETSPLVRHFFFGHMDAVSAGVFRTVQHRIRAREQGIKCRDRLVSDSRADADGGANSVGGTVAPANSKLDRTRSPILLALSGPPGTIAINSSAPNLAMMSSARVLVRTTCPKTRKTSSPKACPKRSLIDLK